MSGDSMVPEVVARAQRGDAQAFGALYDIYAARIYRFMLGHVQEPADAEDLTHQVFLKVMCSLRRYEDRGLPFGAWLFRIARNTLADHGRSRRVLAPLDDEVEAQEDETGQGRLIERANERADIRVALRKLPVQQREVVLLRFFAGLSPAEVGAVLGKREGSVRALQFRALASLRRHLGEGTSWDAVVGEARA